MGGRGWVCELDVVEWREEVDSECGCCDRFCDAFPRFGVEVEAVGGSGGKTGRGICNSSCPTHQSHSNQPRKVAMLPPPTTETGDTCLWNMPTKHTTNIMTEQTCCTMTVESATSGQKS